MFGLLLCLAVGASEVLVGGKVVPADCVVGVVNVDQVCTVRVDGVRDLSFFEGGRLLGVGKASGGKVSFDVRTEGLDRIGVRDRVISFDGGSVNLSVFFLAGKPRGVVSRDRLLVAVNLVGQVDGGDVVFGLSRLVNGHYNPNVHVGFDDAWSVPNYWGRGGASCISNSYFLQRVCDILGLPGSFSVVAIYASPDAPWVPKFDGVTSGVFSKRSVRGDLECFLVDDRNSRGGGVGGVGGMNHYEGCLVHSLNGVKTYYPGGTLFAFSDPAQVLSVFSALVWARFDRARNDFVVVEVIQAYKRGVGGREPVRLLRRGLLRR